LQTTLLIDFSNLAYSSFFAAIRNDNIKPEETPPHYTGHVHVFHQKVQSLQQASHAAKMIFALDQWPKAKAELLPTYKSTRKKMEFNPKTALLTALQSWYCKTIEAQHEEADDVIASYVAQNFDYENIFVATTDKDIWQIADHPNCTIYNFHSNYSVTAAKLKEDFRVDEFRHIRLYKALFGDSGDNIPNATPRMQAHLIPLVIMSNGTLEHFWDIVDVKKGQLSARCQELLEANKKQIAINYELTTLRYNCKLITNDYPAPNLTHGF